MSCAALWEKGVPTNGNGKYEDQVCLDLSEGWTEEARDGGGDSLPCPVDEGSTSSRVCYKDCMN